VGCKPSTKVITYHGVGKSLGVDKGDHHSCREIPLHVWCAKEHKLGAIIAERIQSVKICFSLARGFCPLKTHALKSFISIMVRVKKGRSFAVGALGLIALWLPFHLDAAIFRAG